MGLGLFAVLSRVPAGKTAQAGPHDWRQDWAVAEGFSLSRDSEGYSFPTALAFVPDPGPGPQDPLYFVAELRGRVKVVTNNRSVHTFAENFFSLQPEKELPDVEGETGLAGICLAPEQGYVFVTFAYQDAGGVLRNNVVRFATRPGTFALAPTGQAAFTGVFAGYEAAISHQIGSCQVAGGNLFVSVGDGRQTEASQQAGKLLGKVLRMTFDGRPAPGNPYSSQGGPAAYVWASGFRNPFGLVAAGDRVFVADNGSDLDRFVQVQPGGNYLWDGSDWSIGARADLALAPDIGPSQVAYFPGGSNALPESYAQSFFVAASKPEVAGILRIPYDLEAGRASAPPEYLVKHQGPDLQIVVGSALGPDGLFFVPTLPDAGGSSAVFKAAYQPAEEHPYLLTRLADPEAILWQKGCYGCHQLGDEGGTAGPALDPGPLVERLDARLNSTAYSQSLEEVDKLDREPFQSYHEARLEVAEAQGLEKLRAWMIYHIMEPRFDNPNSQMPNLGVTRPEAARITDYLLAERSFTDRVKDELLKYLPAVPMPRHLFFAFGFGLAAGMLLLALSAGVVSLFRRRRRPDREAGSR